MKPLYLPSPRCTLTEAIGLFVAGVWVWMTTMTWGLTTIETEEK